MHPLRLAYSTLFVVALAAFYLLWNEIAGSMHLDLMPWHVKLSLGVAAAFAFVKAVEAAVSREQAWNGRTLRWSGILLLALVFCGLVTYYYHLYYEEEGEGDEDAVTEVRPAAPPGRPHAA